jgi:PAS domain S-box-containing protein
MVALVAAVSMYGTRVLFDTAIKVERTRLQDMVRSQAALVVEMGWMALHGEAAGGPKATREAIVDHLGRALREFKMKSRTGEFIVARLEGQDISYLLVNGRAVSPADPGARVSLEQADGEPMKRALFGESGTMAGPDKRGVEVLAAYAPIELRYDKLGLVARIDLDEIRAPFIRANLNIFGVGVVLTLFGVLLFIKVSEPLINDLQQSEKSYRDLVEGANNLILRINEAGEITFANSFARTFLAGPDGELLGRALMPFFDIEASGQGLDSVVEIIGGEGRQNEIPVHMADGRVGYVSWTVKLIMDQGRPAELLCIGNDATRIHKANTAQKESEERFRGLAKASPVAIIITDVAGNLLYANEKMHEMTRATAVQLAGQGWLNSVHREDRKLVWKHWLERVGPATDKVELRLMSGNGEFVWVLWQVVEMGNARGKAASGNIHTFTDITEIKEAQLAMSRLNAAIDQAAEMIVMTDLDGVMTYVNPAFEVVSGYSRAEAVGRTTNLLAGGEQTEEFFAQMWETITGGNVWKGRIVNRRKNGERYTLESSIGPIRNHAGELIGFVGLGRDITQQLVVESQLRQSQKLESIGELAAGIAHEINTPTQYVTSNLQFLSDSSKTYAEVVERCRELLGHISEHPDLFPDAAFRERAEAAMDVEEMTYLAEDVPNALDESAAGLKRIAEIVRSIKQLAHPGELAKAFHDLNEITKNAITVSTNEWKYVAEMEFVPDESLAPVFCLKGEVGQVVLNLIVNAAHAIESKVTGEEQGTISIRTRSEGNFAVLEVTDTGTGMPREVAAKAFDPFFTTKEVGKGTGQGLAISHNVVVGMHGGRIEIDSEEGKGTTFTVRLPFEEPAAG